LYMSVGLLFMSLLSFLLLVYKSDLSIKPILGCLVMNLFYKIDNHINLIHRIFLFCMRFSRYVTD
jgi:hypothetical protein